MKIMILWSGGVESTSLLKWFLSETEHEVYAHTIRFDNEEKRDSYEWNAITQLTPLLTAIRPFHFDTSSASICEGKCMPLDRVLYHALGTIAMTFHNCEKLYKGYCAEDQCSRTWSTSPDNEELCLKYIKYHTLEAAYIDKADITRHFLPQHLNFDDVIEVHPTAYWPKSKHVKYLGDMFQYTFSCRRPKNGKTCGKCHSCLERYAAKFGKSFLENVDL